MLFIAYTFLYFTVYSEDSDEKYCVVEDEMGDTASLLLGDAGEMGCYIVVSVFSYLKLSHLRRQRLSN